MKVWKVFFLGLVYGWCMKWIIDEIFTRDQYRMITNENAALKERLSLLERARPLETRPIMQAEPQPVAETRQSTPAPTRVAPSKRTATPSRTDDLKLIKGIGPQLEKKLNDAGVRTFEQMSRLTSTDLQNILGISKRVVQSADNLITQAKKLAQQKPTRK